MQNKPSPEAISDRKPAPGEKPAAGTKPVQETGGPSGPEPTRYGDWERGGRCVDF